MSRNPTLPKEFKAECQNGLVKFQSGGLNYLPEGTFFLTILRPHYRWLKSHAFLMNLDASSK